MDYIKACFEDAVQKDGYIWFFDNRIQAICKMKIYGYEIIIIEKYTGKKEFCGRKIFSCHNRFYIVEGNSTNVLIYDSGFHLKTPMVCCDSIGNEVYRYKENIYFFSSFIDEKIICFDMNRQRYFDICFDKQYLQKVAGKQKIQKGFSCLYKDEVWIPVYRTGFYIRYNLIERKAEIYQAENRKASLEGICYDGKDLWMILENGKIVCDGKKEIPIQEKQSNARLYNTSEFIIKSPRDTNKLILICKDKYEAAIIELPITDEKKHGDKIRSITGCYEIDTHIFLFRHGISDLWALNRETLEIKCIKLQCKNYAKYYLGRTCNEYGDVGLNHLICFLNEDTKNVLYQKDEGKIKGKNIWAYMKK